MKKLFTLLTLLVVAISASWAEDFTVTPITGSYNYTSLAKLVANSPLSISSGQIVTAKSTEGTFTISTTRSDLVIKSISMVDANSTASKMVSLELTSGNGTLSNSSGTWSYTGGTTSSTTFKMTAGSGGQGKLGTISIVVSSSANNIETLSGFSLSSGTYSFTTTVNGETATPTVALTTPTSSGGSVSGPNISLSNGRTITFTSERNIRYIAFNDVNCRAKFIVSSGGGTCDGGTWSSGDTNTKTVTLQNDAGTTLSGLNKVYVITEAAGPVDPTFSLTKTSIGTNETSQIQVGTKGNLDGITLSNLDYDNTKISIDEDGVVTPLVAGGPYTITFNSSAVTGKYNAGSGNLSLTVTAPKYTVQYELNGGNGTAPTQADTEEGGKFNLAAAPTKDFSTFAGWLCDADNQVYAAGAEYEMTAKNTKFTAQWNVTTYSSTLDFAGETIKRAVYGSSTAPTGEKAFTNINTFLESGNMIGTSGLSNNNWEPSDEKTGYIGYKLKATSASVKFMAESGKKVTITFGSIGADVTLKKNGVSSTISANSGDQKQTVVSFDANEDMLVEIVTSSTSNKTVTLNKIAIEDAVASTAVNVGTTGFATIGLPYVSTVPADVTAYTVTPTTSSKVTLSPVEAGATIPAYKGLIIVAEPGNHTFTQKFTEGTSTYDTGTGLLATGAVTRNSAATEGEFYYFAIIDSTHKKVGFKKCAEGATLAANRAYLPGAKIPAASTTLPISFEGEETAINGVAEEASNAAPVKVVKNGQLFIGNYNVAGAQVK